MQRNLSGVELMKQINDGKLKQAPSAYIEDVRSKVTEACEELLEMGARIRPLIAAKEQVGWVRGLHPSERKLLDRWVIAAEDRIANVLTLATTFSKEEIEQMDSLEIRGLLNIVKQMTDYDVSLYPYLGAFVSTMVSENLWHGKGTRLSSFENRAVILPDGKQMRIMAPPDHAKLWASLCTYREQSKKRLDENFNAVLIIRPWAGKNADPIAAELRTMARLLATDAIEPWQKIVLVKEEVNVNDGWAHPGDSIEDLQREMKGFIEGDRHERLMAQFEKQLREEAENRKRKLDDAVHRRGGPGIVDDVTSPILTDQEVREREKALKKGRVVPATTREEREHTTSAAEKIHRYR